MNPSLQVINIPYGTPEWFDFRRKQGIGGSEVGVLLNLVDEYSSPAQIFHEKIGTVDVWKEDNQAMFWGRELEEKIADIWQYWDGDGTGYLKNRAEGNIVRKCRNVNGFIVNPKYPWLFASVDRLINKEGGFDLLNGEELDKEGILEIKTIEDRSAAKWEAGIPPYYIAQVNQYMLILELDYAEIAILENGRRLSVLPMRRSDAICKTIVDTTKFFWYNRVVPARNAYWKAKALRESGNVKLAEEQEAIMQKLEPGATSGEAYKQFISERFSKTREEIEGTIDLQILGVYHKSVSELVKAAEQLKSEAHNQIAKLMVERGAEFAKFPNRGYLRYFKTKGTSVYRVDNRLKLDVDKDKLEAVLSGINVNYTRWKNE